MPKGEKIDSSPSDARAIPQKSSRGLSISQMLDDLTIQYAIGFGALLALRFLLKKKPDKKEEKKDGSS